MPLACSARIPEHATRRTALGDGVLTNTDLRSFDVIELTNEMPVHRNGGVGTVVEGLMTGLAYAGLRVLWFLTDHKYSPSQVRQVLDLFPNVAAGSSDDLKGFDAPVVHVHAYQQNPALHKYLKSQRTVTTIHSLLALEEASNDVDLAGATQMQEALIALSTCVVLVSEAERRRYSELGYDSLNANTRVVHNGLADPRSFRAPRSKHWLGFCGRLVPRKHPEYVQLVLNEPGFENGSALIAGRGFSTYAKNLLRRQGLNSRVRFLGWCAGARLEAYFDAVDVLAMPSIYEPFGLVALEAMARGIPVVGTPVDGLVEVLGENAFYSRDVTYPAFRTAMEAWLAATDEELAEMARSARARYEASFTDVAMGERYRRLFEDLTA